MGVGPQGGVGHANLKAGDGIEIELVGVGLVGCEGEQPGRHRVVATVIGRPQ
ncbi:hypothetical protein ACIQWL_37470 [Streptomyces mirabilis]|uniref:hypothetical protein n=1 Tax=Streptomyces mirabilis TaxID=68239 RepID=UPI003822ED91